MVPVGGAVAVESLDAPELAPYRTLRRPLEHRQAAIFVAEGAPVVRRLLASPLEVVSVLVSPRWLAELEPELAVRAQRPLALVAPEGVLAKIVGFRLHQGVMAVGRVPAAPELDAVLEAARPPRLVVALDGVTNPENVGAIVRSAAAFAAAAVVVGETAASPWLRRAVRSSMGAVLALPVVEVAGLVATLERLERCGVAAVATSPHGTTAVDQADLSGDVCLVVGHEGLGVRPTVLSACRRVVRIPMPAGVDSLNAASAAAVFIYETARQQGAGRSRGR